VQAQIHIERAGLDVSYYRDWVRDPDQALGELLDHPGWRQDQVRVFGKRHPIPRLHQWMGEASYAWSGLQQAPAPLHPSVDAMRKRLSERLGLGFNGVLLNLYRDGQDRMGWHADDERGLAPVIASVSLGATRDFVLRRKDRTGERVVLPLKHGSLLVMRGTTQQHWHHALPRRTRVAAPRINLTFRALQPDEWNARSNG